MGEVKKTQRNSNIELLRILCAVCIIAGHMRGQAFDDGAVNSIGVITGLILGAGLRIATNIFVMIALYFMVESNFSAARVLKMYGTLWLYSAPSTVILFVLGEEIGMSKVVNSLLPFSRQWIWFISMYIAMLLLSPFLKILVINLNKRGIELLLLVGFFLICVTGSLPTSRDTFLCNLVWFMYIYIFMFYFRKYVDIDRLKKYKFVFLFIGITIVATLVVMREVSECGESIISNAIYRMSQQYLDDLKTIPNFVAAFSIFLFFLCMETRENIFINALSKNALDVYMIHAMPSFYMILWVDILQTRSWQSSNLFMLFFVFSIFVVYIGCSIVGRVRVRLIEPLWTRSKLFKCIEEKLDRIYESVCI